jgi:hypothetical protein
LHLSVWLNCSIAGAMVVAGALLFVLAWLFSPGDGLVWRWRQRRTEPDPGADVALPPG